MQMRLVVVVVIIIDKRGTIKEATPVTASSCELQAK
jgi:hypothetical protein